MSLWRIRHGLPPAFEYGLVAVAAAYGLFAIYMTSLEPLIVAGTADIRSVGRPITLDLDAWERHEHVAYGFAFATPPGWIVRERGPGVLAMARSQHLLAAAGTSGGGLSVEIVPLHERRQVENLAAEEFAGRRPALYDVGVDGRTALFAVEFRRGRVGAQVVYVPFEGRAYVLRGGGVDPAVFATFVTSFRFAPES